MFTKLLSQTFLGLCLLSSITAQASAEASNVFLYTKAHAAPLLALQEAVKLMDQRRGPVVSQPEMDIFKKVAAGHSNQCDTIETLLTVSRVTDPKQRQAYSQKIKTMVEGARSAIKGFTKDNDKAAVLGNYLQEHGLRGGYVDGQSEILQTLNKQTYDCVSSATLYFIIGEQLGIKMIVEQAPEHVFLRMGDVTIEPTSGRICYAAEAKQNFDRLWAEARPADKFIYGRTGYVLSDKMTLIGDMYRNRSNRTGPSNEQLVAAGLKACCMAPSNPVYSSQAGVTLYNWMLDCVNRKDFAKAHKIAAIFSQLYGDGEMKKISKEIGMPS